MKVLQATGQLDEDESVGKIQDLVLLCIAEQKGKTVADFEVERWVSDRVTEGRAKRRGVPTGTWDLAPQPGALTTLVRFILYQLAFDGRIEGRIHGSHLVCTAKQTLSKDASH